MESLKYKNWIEDGVVLPPIEPQNSGLSAIAKAFEQNRDRVFHLGSLPYFLVAISITKAHVIATAISDLKQGKVSPHEIDDKVGEMAQKAMKDGPASIQNVCAEVEAIAKLPTGQASIGLEALLSSIVILAFGAFENLAIDLWTEAVNSRPRKLAMNAIGPGKAKPKGDDSAKAAQEKMIPFSDLADYDFNVSGKMGHVLRDRKVVSFESFEGIKYAYEAVFLKDGEKAKCPDLGKILGDHVFPICQLIRNLYAHKSGIVDQKFHDRIKQYDTRLATVTTGNPLSLDFQEVRGYVNTLFSFPPRRRDRRCLAPPALFPLFTGLLCPLIQLSLGNAYYVAHEGVEPLKWSWVGWLHSPKVNACPEVYHEEILEL